MSFSTGSSSLSLKEVHEQIDDAELVSKYLGINKIPCFIHSPLREDKNPSFGLYTRDGKRIYWTDLATREGGGIYDLLSRMWHCNYTETLVRIRKDIGNFIGKADTKAIHTYIKNAEEHRKNTDLQCKVREWRNYDIDYWASYGVPVEWLKYAEVYPISHKIIISNGNRYVFGADKYAYAYVERKEGKVTLKIYQPYNKYKWSNKHDRSVISLWTKVPEYGDIIVICSSLKDALCLWANTGIPAMAVQGEGYTISSTAISELKRRYKCICILFDNDEAGLKDGEKLSMATGFINLVLPEFEGGKDVSDLFKAKGREEFLNIMKSLFRNMNKQIIKANKNG